MKKKVTKVKKLQLSKETLRDLGNLDAQKALGGNQDPISPQSQCFDGCTGGGPTN